MTSAHELDARRSLGIDLHGIGLVVQSDHERVLEALESRFSPFLVDSTARRGRVTFDIRRDDGSEELAPGPSERGRIVYDSDLGEVRYRDRDDSLTIHCGSVWVHADLARGCVTMRYATGTDEELALTTHPLFTLTLLEVLKREQRFSLHAACVADGDDGVLIAGASGSGKTTLSVALSLAGMTFLSDDMVFLRSDPGVLRVLAFPDELDLTDDTVQRFDSLRHLEGRPTWGGRPKHQLRADAGLGVRIALGCRPGALVFPRITGRSGSTVEPCAASDALVELTPNVLLTHAQSAQRHLDALGRLAREVPTFRLELGTDLEEAVRTIRRIGA